MTSLLFCVTRGSETARDVLEKFENGLNVAGYVPYALHRVSGGVRMVYGLIETVSGVALGIIVTSAGYLREEKELQNEGVKLFDFAIHGVANMVRGFIETRRWVNLVFILYDYGVPKNQRIEYSRPFFGG
jgi:hypothetical protein